MKAAEVFGLGLSPATVTDFTIGNHRGCSGEISVDHPLRQCGARDLFRRAKIGRRSGVKFGCRGHAECKNIASERRRRRLAELLDPERTKLAARQSVEQIDADLLLTAWTHGPFPPWPCTLVSAALAFTNRLLRGSLAAPGCEHHVESRAVMMTGGLPYTSRRMHSTRSAGRNISLTKRLHPGVQSLVVLGVEAQPACGFRGTLPSAILHAFGDDGMMTSNISRIIVPVILLFGGPALAQPDTRRGLSLAREHCAQCHAIDNAPETARGCSSFSRLAS
jgi:hypothetical protein